MDVQAVVEGLKDLEEDKLLDLLEAVSDEVRRRNGMIGPDIGDFRRRSLEENVKVAVEALAGLGVKVGPR